MILRKNLVLGPNSIITEILEDVIGTTFPNFKIAGKSFTIVSVYFDMMFNKPSSVIAIKDFIFEVDSGGYFNEKFLTINQKAYYKKCAEFKYINNKQKEVLKEWFNSNENYKQALESSNAQIRQALL